MNVSKPNFRREWLESEASMYSGDHHDAQMAAALPLLFAVLDAAVMVRDQGMGHKAIRCGICRTYGGDSEEHTDDCPVAACIEAGLGK